MRSAFVSKKKKITFTDQSQRIIIFNIFKNYSDIFVILFEEDERERDPILHLKK